MTIVEPEPPSPERMRLPGTYASDHARDPNPRIGRAVLIALIVLDAMGVLVELYQYLATGQIEALLALATRQVFSASLYFTFWAGWSWARWVATAGDALAGLWLVVWGLHLRTAFATSLGVFCLAVAAFFAFSPDLTAFIAQRRQQRSARALLPLALLLAGYLAVLTIGWSALAHWRKAVERKAVVFARESMREIGARWEVSALERFSSPALLAAHPAEERRQRCEQFRDRYGAIQSIEAQPGLHEVVIRSEGRRRFTARGAIVFSAESESGPLEVRVDLSGNLRGDDWKIEAFFLVPNGSAGAEPAPSASLPHVIGRAEGG